MSNINIGKLAIIGAGAMGSAFARGIVSYGLAAAPDITVSDINEKALEDISAEIGVATSADNLAAVNAADVVMLAVKPWMFEKVVGEFVDSIPPSSNKLLISIAAGVKLETIERLTHGRLGVIRAMPNTPCQIGSGAVGFARGYHATGEQVAIAEAIFHAVGMAFEVEEKLLDAVTGLSGSGPAYAYLIIEAMADAGVRVGLPRQTALSLAAQTLMGSALMVIESGKHPAQLRDQVTTPGGTTICGLEALEKGGLRAAMFEAVHAATERSKELG